MKLTFVQGQAQRDVEFSCAVPLSELAAINGIALPMPCAGEGRCGGCAVDITGDMLPPDENERQKLRERGLTDRRLACRVILTGDCRLRLDSPPPRIEMESSLPVSESADIGFAVDIGTTTVNAALVDRTHGCVLCRISALNDQRLYGADVMTRISSCEQYGTEVLHSVIVRQISNLLEICAEHCEIPPERVGCMAVTGNTVMLHIAAGISPESIGTAPYQPDEYFGRVFESGETGLPMDAYFMPCVSGFVGSDLVACLTACELPEGALLCDLGTNGEIALRIGGRYYTSSAAAGPALEGGGIACGSGAINGAVSRIYEENGVLQADVIGGGRAKSLCGGAVLSAAAILLSRGDILPSGRMTAERHSLVGDTFLTAQDVRQLQLAKGAVAAAMLCTVNAAKVSETDISRIIFTGGLGCYTDIGAARDTGLIPPALTCPAETRPALALEGAICCLWEDGRKLAQETAAKCQSVPLGGSELFDELFIENMSFPGDEDEAL